MRMATLTYPSGETLRGSLPAIRRAAAAFLRRWTGNRTLALRGRRWIVGNGGVLKLRVRQTCRGMGTVFCTSYCRDSFRCDRRAGVFYPAVYEIAADGTRTGQWWSHEEFCRRSQRCAFCGDWL